MARRTWLRDYGYSNIADSPTMRQLVRALEILNYDFAYLEERDAAVDFLARFQQRWGNLSTTTIEVVAHRFVPVPDVSRLDGDAALFNPQTSEEEDTRFALAVLGVLRASEAPSLLLPYLTSPRVQERWLAAFGLAALHDERVFSALEQMFVEFVGPYQPSQCQSTIVQTLRHRLLCLLGEWGNPQAVPSIRAGLIATVRAEEIEVPEPQGPEQAFVLGDRRYTGLEAWQRFHNEQLVWVDEEHLFVYALGRLGAFGALEGAPTRSGIYSWQDSWVDDNRGRRRHGSGVPESHAEGFRANIWRVHACLGALETRFRGHIGTIYDFSDAPELAEAVDRLLAAEFELDEAARRRAMEDYDQASWVHWTLFRYGWRAEQFLENEDDDDEAEGEEQDGGGPAEISLEDMEAQDLGW